jgi:enoyl-CoA hydratase/carnithine racemase
MAAVVAAGQSLAEDRSVRAVVLSGEGRAFCAGLDLAAFQQMAGPPPEAPGGSAGSGDADVASGIMATGERETHLGQEAGWVWRRLEVPVIAAITGPCLGGGLQIALGADIRIAAPDAKLSVMEIKWGLVPDMAGMVLMRGLVRDDVARELTWTGRIFGGEEAVAMGLATRVCADPRADALALAREIASKNPDAIRAGKRLLNLTAEADQHAILLAESKEQGALIGSTNQVEAVMSNLQKREAQYAD